MDFAQATLSGRPYKFKRRQFFIPLLFNLHDHLEPLEIFFSKIVTQTAQVP